MWIHDHVSCVGPYYVLYVVRGLAPLSPPSPRFLSRFLSHPRKQQGNSCKTTNEEEKKRKKLGGGGGNNNLDFDNKNKGNSKKSELVNQRH